MSDRDYCYPPDYSVLRNKLNIRDAAMLEVLERQVVAMRVVGPVPTGDFDLAHLTAIHRHLFQDIYAWAGEIRTVEISKGESWFQPTRYISLQAWQTFITASCQPGISEDQGRTNSPRAPVR